MNKYALIALFLLPGMVHAVICKSVDADGVVSYTDMPASECQKPVKLPPSSTYEPRQLPATGPGGIGVQGSEQVGFTGYTSIKIVQPEANGTVRSSEGKVSVAVGLDPALQKGHRIKLFIDGGAVPGEFTGTSIQLEGVERGTHSLRAVVSDASGRRLGDSPSVRFTLRKPGLFDNALPETPVNPVEPPPVEPGYPAPGDPPDYRSPDPDPDYSVPDPDYSTPSPNYTPPGGGISTTPGQTNPAFRPKFAP